jgi:hypothetical protein
MAEPQTYNVFLVQPFVVKGLADTRRTPIAQNVSWDEVLAKYQSQLDDYELYAIVDDDGNAVLVENNTVEAYPGGWRGASA